MELTVNIVEEILKEYFKLNNYSQSTQAGSIYYLKRFDRFVKKELKINDYRDIKEDDYYRYVEYLKLKKGNEVDLKYHNIEVRRIFRILEKEEKILIDPFTRIEAIKKKRNIRDKILSEEEIFKIMEVNETTTTEGFRNRVIIEVLYGTGLRIRELCNLELQDFFIEEGLIFVRNGKGGKDRIVPLGENAGVYLKEYIKKIRKKLLKGKKQMKMFLSVYGNVLTVWQVRQVLRVMVKKAGIKKEVTPHVIRHSFATHLLKRGADIREIQLLLGHSRISSTQVYINLNQGHLKEEYEKYHPLENELYFDVYARESKILKGELDLGIQQISKKELT